MKPPTEKTAGTHPSSMSSVVPLRPTVRTFYGATDLLADNRRSVGLIVLW